MPHDQPLKTKKEMLAAAPKDEIDDGPADSGADLNAMFAEVNNLPADDPLRGSAKSADAADSTQPVAASTATPAPVSVAAKKQTTKSGTVMDLLPAKVLAAFRSEDGIGYGGWWSESDGFAGSEGDCRYRWNGSGGLRWMRAGGWRCRSFDGASLRKVVERAGDRPAGAAGGQRDGARSGAAAGTMVPVGTEVVVRFAR